MKTILYLEDNADDAYLLRRALLRAGLPVQLHVTTTGQETFDYLHGKPPYHERALYPWPDLILLDIHIPGEDGLELLRRFRSTPGGNKPCVIAVSDSASPTHSRQAIELGAREFFIKPQDHKDWVIFLQAVLFNKGASPGQKD